ncbi:hypothetical protein [Kordiimonas gwangyangensis]|uniref:hypothetical protein n=1 Tax=Kordiimonas gwangyangensis TaxID=288022 RepID=UPI00037F84FC|nr:hypothetical protein [Kordiimonas gwangyangensis]
MARKLNDIANQFERMLPAFALALVLALQGVVASGAADSFLYPALVGPDGRTATISDICNSTGEAKHAGSHCGACTQLAAAVLPAAILSLQVPKATISRAAVMPSGVKARRFEAHSRLRRGPPTI